MAVLLSSEHVDWTDEHVSEEILRQSEAAPIEELIRQRREVSSDL